MSPTDDFDTADTTQGSTRRTGGPEYVTRRSLLAAVGTGATLLAGCTSDEQSGQTRTTGTATTVTREQTSSSVRRADLGDPVEPVFDIQSVVEPVSNWDHSPYQSTISTGDNPISVTLTPHGANAAHPTLDYEPLLMAENELVDGRVWRNKIAEGFTWHDGTDVTIRDRYNWVKYNELRREKFGNETRFESVELVDDRTMELTLHEKQHPTAFLATNEPWIGYQRSLFEPYLERMQAATTSREAFEVHSEFERETIAPEDWVGNSLWQISSVTETEVRYERYEDYPEEHARYQNIQELRVPIIQDRSEWLEKIKNDETDWINGVDRAMAEEAATNSGYQVPKKKTTKQYIFRLNHTNKHLARPGVRRALAYIKRYGEVYQDDPSKYPDPIQDGTTDAIGSQWIPDYESRVENYIQYGTDGKPDEAAAELRAEGYERNGDGMWVGPDGDLLEVDVSTPWWFPVKTFTGWMQQFGFTTRVKRPNVFWDTYASYENDWDIIVGFHSRGPNHPTSSYKNDPRWGLKMTNLNEQGERVPAGNRKLEYELPTDLGATDLSGDTRTVDIPELQARLSDPEATAEDYVEPMRTLGWWWNYYVPDLVAVGGYYNFLGDFENFEWLDWNADGAPDATNSYEFSYCLNTGYLHGKEA